MDFIGTLLICASLAAVDGESRLSLGGYFNLPLTQARRHVSDLRLDQVDLVFPLDVELTA